MKRKENIFTTIPEKASARVAINGVMLASVFVMLAVIFLELDKFNPLAVAQMILSIPLLYVSSLAYSKLGYWKETKRWDIFGYFTNTIGNLFLINGIGLVASILSFTVSFIYFGLMILLLFVYSYINVSHTKRIAPKLFKFLFSLAILFFGGILPLLLQM
ncbi:hypothetical protein HOG16_04260 [Candidatus Woesearchaeota archaeon]|jgi:hypothetical protein|nr:hypothetical protein [Candidatus Woesearchaeota archaeon]MBT4321933.1 hypothetical protein [Candidatus Woesearchaeota archaeon]MBT4631285.1 hypothetical protein [Candidatus Woesearchaeota archaeon]